VAGVVVFFVGRVIDLIWHATHPEFETAGDQLRAHAVVWLGAHIMLAASGGALLQATKNRGYAVVLAGGLGYAGVAAWHFGNTARCVIPTFPTCSWRSPTSSC
jgi:ABC-type uncharacterized transport system permease subunit